MVAMQKWEYLVVRADGVLVFINELNYPIQKFLDSQGQVGWELVTAVKTGEGLRTLALPKASCSIINIAIRSSWSGIGCSSSLVIWSSTIAAYLCTSPAWLVKSWSGFSRNMPLLLIPLLLVLGNVVEPGLAVRFINPEVGEHEFALVNPVVNGNHGHHFNVDVRQRSLKV